MKPENSPKSEIHPLENLAGWNADILSEQDHRLLHWLNSLPPGVVPRIGNSRLNGQHSQAVKDALMDRSPLHRADTILLFCNDKKSIRKIESIYGEVWQTFDGVCYCQIIYKGEPLDVVQRFPLKTHQIDCTIMGKTTATIKTGNGVQNPRSKLLQAMPRFLNQFPRCTRAVHGKDGIVKDLIPYITEKRLALPVKEIIGAPLTALPSGIADPIAHGIEEALRSPDGYFENTYTYRWQDRNWSFIVTYQYLAEFDEVVRCTYDPPGREFSWQEEYWWGLIKDNPELAWVS